MLRILVLELLHCDLDLFDSAGDSMKAEGREMLFGIAEDLSACPEAEITLAAVEPFLQDWSARHPEFSWMQTASVESLCEQVEEQERRFDLAFCIAPECDGLLTSTITTVSKIADRLICAGDELVRLGSDKLLFHDWCVERQLPTIPVLDSCQTDRWPLSSNERVVSKDRFGAGSENIQRYQWNEATRTIVQQSENHTTIWQPYWEGQAFSVGIIGRGQRAANVVLPVAEQTIVWEEDRPRYTGGRLPARMNREQRRQLECLLDRLIPDLDIHDGYVGIDLLLTSDFDSCWKLMELNPRLCTSYLGYRQLFGTSLAQLWWDSKAAPPPESSVEWRQKVVEFKISSM